jgi:hypothetical protein
MTEPLVSTDWLLLAWMVLGGLAAFALTVVVLLRKAPPLTTQIDRVTGMKHHGILTWLAGFLLVFVGPPLAILIVRYPVAWLAAHWLEFTIAGILAVLGWGGWRLWQTREAMEPMVVEPALPHNHVPTAPHQTVGWSLPADADQWDRR